MEAAQGAMPEPPCPPSRYDAILTCYRRGNLWMHRCHARLCIAEMMKSTGHDEAWPCLVIVVPVSPWYLRFALGRL